MIERKSEEGPLRSCSPECCGTRVKDSLIPHRTSEPLRISIRPAKSQDLIHVLEIVRRNNLPTEGINDHFSNYLVAVQGTMEPGIIVPEAFLDRFTVIGSIGLELYPPIGLLRSLAVVPEHHCQGVGTQLVRSLLEHAQRLGIQSVVLLTTTAAAFFERFGFARVERETIPAAVSESKEFQINACHTAQCMSLALPRR